MPSPGSSSELLRHSENRRRTSVATSVTPWPTTFTTPSRVDPKFRKAEMRGSVEESKFSL
ncbi:Uncharacterised protein [Mycobacteroides abscessus subsp. abscessus]|nr:Uncharacterised protein [Mycobacteroides abscessus subsp. abscessus]